MNRDGTRYFKADSGILVNLVTWTGMNQPISHWGTLDPLLWFMMATLSND